MSVASASRFEFVNMLRSLNCPKSRFIAQYSTFINSAEALKICRLLRSVRCSGAKFPEADFVNEVGRLEFDSANIVVTVAFVKTSFRVSLL